MESAPARSSPFTWRQINLRVLIFFLSLILSLLFFLLLFLERVPVHLTSLSFPSLPLLLFFRSLPRRSLFLPSKFLLSIRPSKCTRGLISLSSLSTPSCKRLIDGRGRSFQSKGKIKALISRIDALQLITVYWRDRVRD